MKSQNLENFQKLISEEKSGWLDKFLYYEKNKKWLDQSNKVAINVLEALKAKKMSQKDLAGKMKVSAQQINKIVKGQQNLTFETIAKLETALEISLMEIVDFKPLNNIQTNSTQIKAIQKSISEELNLGLHKTQVFSDDFTKKQGANMSVIYNKLKQPLNYQIAV